MATIYLLLFLVTLDCPEFSDIWQSSISEHAGAKHKKFLKGKNVDIGGIRSFFPKSNPASVEPSSFPIVICASSNLDTLDDAVGASKDILDTEIVWCLKVVTTHYSYRSSSDVGKLFSSMFPGSAIARHFSCSERKLPYLCLFEITPYFQSHV
ncbi:uncharacterized protein LOC118202725 [Stegodyphus dumicola]|uniref:uncharacterized protein LOC118202725 n=1 Tax=Stegodyphus dumicola TaxID=202533 RepID=UPI0015A8879E|nr:uncharacterized protein LOC118202725 [Stegodyphus dumicola]